MSAILNLLSASALHLGCELAQILVARHPSVSRHHLRSFPRNHPAQGRLPDLPQVRRGCLLEKQPTECGILHGKGHSNL